MNGEEASTRDRQQTIIIVLSVLAAVLAGMIIGFVVSGGLSGEPTAVPTTTLVEPSSSTSVPTTVPPVTLIPGQLSVPATEDTDVTSAEATEVTATVETDPVPSSGDAADDPAIWVHPIDPSLSTIIGTDKEGGLAVYDLSGRQIQYISGIRPNNVDIRHGFPLGANWSISSRLPIGVTMLLRFIA